MLIKMGSGDGANAMSKCLTCQIVELFAKGISLSVITFFLFNAACDIQLIRRDIRCIGEEVRERRDQRIRERVIKEGEEYMDSLSDRTDVTDITLVSEKISTTIKDDGPSECDGQKDDNE